MEFNSETLVQVVAQDPIAKGVPMDILQDICSTALRTGKISDRGFFETEIKKWKNSDREKKKSATSEVKGKSTKDQAIKKTVEVIDPVAAIKATYKRPWEEIFPNVREKLIYKVVKKNREWTLELMANSFMDTKKTYEAYFTMAYGTMVFLGEKVCREHEGPGLYHFISEQERLAKKQHRENKNNFPADNLN
jgi:hypothetical protein